MILEENFLVCMECEYSIETNATKEEYDKMCDEYGRD